MQHFFGEFFIYFSNIKNPLIFLLQKYLFFPSFMIKYIIAKFARRRQ